MKYWQGVIILLILAATGTGLISEGVMEIKLRSSNYTGHDIYDLHCLNFSSGTWICNTSDVIPVVWNTTYNITTVNNITEINNFTVINNLTENVTDIRNNISNIIQNITDLRRNLTNTYIANAWENGTTKAVNPVGNMNVNISTTLYYGNFATVVGFYPQGKPDCITGYSFIDAYNGSNEYWSIGDTSGASCDIDMFNNWGNIRVKTPSGGSLYPLTTKSIHLGTSSLSWDNCYCDDFVTTPPQKTFLVNDSISKLKLLQDISFLKNGEINYTSIPYELRDEKGNNDTLSLYAIIMAQREIILNLTKDMAIMKNRIALIK